MKSNWSTILFATLFVALLASAGSSVQAQDASPEMEKTYAFTYFVGNGEDGLHLAVSHDAKKWKPVREGKSLFRPSLSGDNLLRDPSICRGPDGLYHMVWTTSWNNRFIGYACSPDLIHWTNEREVPVMEHEPTCRNSWAPELFYDAREKCYYIVWASTLPGRFSNAEKGSSEDRYDHRLYYTTTRDFKTFAPTKLYFDPGYNVIDGFLAQRENTYYLFYKDERLRPERKVILLATSTSPTGPFSEGRVISAQNWVEGPAAIIINGEWLVLYDRYRDNCYGGVTSPDGQTWTNVSDQVELPSGIRHGTALEIDNETYNKLCAP